MRSIICGALMALTVTTAGAEDNCSSADFMAPHCKFALTDHAERSFLAGMCVGSIRAIARLAATPRASVLCAALPDSVTLEQMVRVVVRYIEARPQRMHEAFFVLAIEALLDAWPCK